MLNEINKFLQGNDNKLEGKAPLNDIMVAICQLLNMDEGTLEFESNGWDQDYWINIKGDETLVIQEERITVSGSMYYGTYVILKTCTNTKGDCNAETDIRKM